jgi:hypothetical protein
MRIKYCSFCVWLPRKQWKAKKKNMLQSKKSTSRFMVSYVLAIFLIFILFSRTFSRYPNRTWYLRSKYSPSSESTGAKLRQTRKARRRSSAGNATTVLPKNLILQPTPSFQLKYMRKKKKNPEARESVFAPKKRFSHIKVPGDKKEGRRSRGLWRFLVCFL